MELSDRPLAPAPYELLPPVPQFTVTSADFKDGEPLAIDFAGPGNNMSPQLSWSGFPPETKSFLINVFDPDAPTPAGFWHWTVANIPVEVTDLNTAAGKSNATLPSGALHLPNDGGDNAYFGPYPPAGDRPHRYVFAVHALDTDTLEVTPETTPTKAAFQALFHTIARATITGTYQH